ncbi:bacillithiol biosynthesis deacetylase BshB2 [Paenibacillus sp. CC-CFT747]|nr:bacillithiol biosynthesis deacetylase BshB2 [Paenibacillus sp. CC-CFT747]
MDKRILLVLPHPDDEAFGVSGTLAMAIKEGTQVTYACLTLGEMGRNMGIPPFANRVTLPQIRRIELEESCRAIGIQDLRMLGFHDKMVEFEDPAVVQAAVTALVEELRPELVITFYPGFSVHPDHDATGAAVIGAIARMPAGKRPTVHAMAFSSNCRQVLGPPDIVRDVTAYLPQKMASIQAHRSQFQAAELLGSKELSEEELIGRYGTERFWTYRFEDEHE